MAPASLTSLTAHLADRAAGYGTAADVVGGCDPFDVFGGGYPPPVERVRAGAGLALVECKTVRLSGHCHRPSSTSS